MILKTLLKTFIYDYCVNIIFKGISKNIASKKPKEVPQVGEYFRKIISYDKCEFFLNCKVIEVYQEGNDWAVDFTYDYYYLLENPDDDISDEESYDYSFVEDDFDSVNLSEYDFIK